MTSGTEHKKARSYYYITTFFALFGTCPLLLHYIILKLDLFEIPILLGPYLVPSYFIGALSIAIFITRHSLRAGKEEVLEYYGNCALRYIIAFIMFHYGIDKLLFEFFHISYRAMDVKLGDVRDFFLNWYYWGRSSWMVLLIGLMEAVPALLLLFRRTAFLGTVLILPATANVFLLNAFNRISPFTLIVSFFLLLFTLTVLYSYKKELKELFINTWNKTKPSIKNVYIKIPFALFKVLFLSALILTFLTRFHHLFVVKPQKALRSMVGAYELESCSLDDHRIEKDSLPFDFYKKIYIEERENWNSVRTLKDSLSLVKITVKEGKDSISISPREDLTLSKKSTPRFRGSYEYHKDTLLILKGEKGGTPFQARYKKMPYPDHEHWW